MENSSLYGDTLDTLLKRFEDIHNYIYANDGLSEQQVLEEIVKILFIKFYDEQNEKKSFYGLDTEISKMNTSEKQNSFLNRIGKIFE